MKRAFIFVFAFLLPLLTGCRSDEKVTVIKGPGSANNSLMVDFGELCPGYVEGFSGKSLIVSRDNGGNRIEFYGIDTSSKEQVKLLSAFKYSNYYFKVSRNGEKFLYENYMVDIEKKSSLLLPKTEAGMPHRPGGFPPIADYSFDGSGGLIYINPFYYINKYYKNKVQSFKEGTEGLLPASFMKIRDSKESIEIPGYYNIEIPEIDFIKDGELLLDQLKYVFIGHKKGSDETPLYIFDIFEKRFQLADPDVKSYYIAPDNKKIAFIKKAGGGNFENKLIISDIDGKEKKGIKTFQEIAGVAWSADGNWLAYTGGEREKNDVYIIKSDGSDEEQLTQGINPTGKIAWSESGDEIAFTSGYDDAEPKQTVYLIKMNMDMAEKSENTVQNTAREEMMRKLGEIIRVETDANRRKTVTQ